jgi:hypothetical protein
MINGIISGICKKLREEFGEGYKVYTEQVKQGLTEPCFFVLCVSRSDERYMFGRRHMILQFCVYYFSADSEDVYADCNRMNGRLYTALSYILIGENLMRGTKMRTETVDGVLNFFVNYDVYVFDTPDPGPPAMKTLILNGKTGKD